MGFGALTLIVGISLPAALFDSNAFTEFIRMGSNLLPAQPVSEPTFLVLFGGALAFTAWGIRRGHVHRRTE
jgi:hypothetical protein